MYIMGFKKCIQGLMGNYLLRSPSTVQSINESLFVGRHLLILEDCGKSTSSFLLLQRDLAHFSNPHEHPITVIAT